MVVAVYKHRANSACTEGFAAPLPERFVSLTVIPVLPSREGSGVPDNSGYFHKYFAFKFKFIDVIVKCKYGARIRNTSKLPVML